jgi:ABC-type phosphate transport system substrate-binding protein
MKRLAVLSIALVVVSACSFAGEVKIIANSSVTASSITADELRNVFLETSTTLSDGSHVLPVLAKGGAAHQEFVKDYLGKTDSALQMYYRGLVFTGKASMPKEEGSDTDIAAYVAKTKGAIGYVSVGASTTGVKTLQVR